MPLVILEPLLRSLILTIDAVVDDPPVGLGVGTRIYPDVRPQGSALPALTYQRVAERRNDAVNTEGALTPPLVARRPLTDARIQINAFAADYGAAKTLGHTLRAALNGYVGPPGGLRGIKFLDESDEQDEPSHTWWLRMDYSVWCEED